MATKAVAKLNNATEFAALSQDNGDLRLALEENIGSDTLSEFDIDRVHPPAGGGITWEIPTLQGTDTTKTIEGIIIAWFNRRAYWPGKFSGGNEPPQCSSLDGITGEGVPGGNCVTCPFAQFGSSEHEESPNAQACKAVRQLFVLTPNAMLPMVVTLPPTSLRNARQYFLRLSSAGIPHTGIITKLTLEKDRSASGFEFSKVVLNAGDRLTEDARSRVLAYSEALVPTFTHKQTVAAIAARGLGGELAPDNGAKLIYGYATASALANHLLSSGYAPSNDLFGRGSGFRADLAALEEAGF